MGHAVTTDSPRDRAAAILLDWEGALLPTIGAARNDLIDRITRGMEEEQARTIAEALAARALAGVVQP